LKEVDSDALGVVSRALGLSGIGAPLTEFLDGSVHQTLDVTSLARRGRTQAGTGGIYRGVLTNIHSAANTVVSSINPYAVGTTAVIAPYPDPMPAGFDVWLLGAALRQTSGTGTLAGVLSVSQPSAQGWGITSAGAAQVVNLETPVAFWDALSTVFIEFGILNELGVYKKLGMRLASHADTALIFRSTSSAAANFEVQVITGVFPVALGQDGIT